MSDDPAVNSDSVRAGRVPPYSEEAEKGVLGSVLLDSARVMDLCIQAQLDEVSFFVPAHRVIYRVMRDMASDGKAIDLLTVAEQLRDRKLLDRVGGDDAILDHLVDATPTAAHAEYYIDIVRQKHLLRAVIDCARQAEKVCHEPAAQDDADAVLNTVEQSFLAISEKQRGKSDSWDQIVKNTMLQVEYAFTSQGVGGLRGISTGFANLDKKIQGLKGGEMVVLAARPSMGKTSLAMNIVENVALGVRGDRKPRAVGVFSLEMSAEALVLRLLCAHAEVPMHRLSSGFVSGQEIHGRLVQAASVIGRAKIYLDDTGGLDVLELRSRARTMKAKYNIDLIAIDYLQLLHSSNYARQGLQVETANISSHLKGMAKELNVPVLVLSQLSRAPEQRDKTGKPKMSDLRDSGAIEQDADIIMMLRRPCRYEADPEYADTSLAIVDVVKQRNGPVGEVRLDFQDEYTRFRDRADEVEHEIEPLEPEDELEPL